MQEYKNLLQRILDEGGESANRTGVDTISTWGTQNRYDLRKGFPATTTKKLAWKSVISELLWFLEGSPDERRLAEIHYQKDRKELIGKETIWTANADKQGKDLGYANSDTTKNLGPVYGVQWRSFVGYDQDHEGGSRVQEVDQIKRTIERIKEKPDCRRIIISAWNAAEVDEMALPPCHVLSHFRVINGELHCHMFQRSADTFLGVPFNIASYALLTHIFARECGLGVGELVHTISDAHIYVNHIDQVKELLSREPLPLPTLEISPDFYLNKVLEGRTEDEVDMFRLVGYQSHGTIKADMVV